MHTVGVDDALALEVLGQGGDGLHLHEHAVGIRADVRNL